MMMGQRRSIAFSMRARDLLADDHAHAAADERVLLRGHDGVDAVDRS